MKVKIFILLYLYPFTLLAKNKTDENEIIKGTLKNGITYFICKNETKKNVADFYFIQNFGALVEDDHEDGFAHFCEHMCFHASTNFPQDTFFTMMRNRGYGNKMNAITAPNKITYFFTDINTADHNLIDTCLLRMSDYCDNMLFLSKDIEKERMVITEEWRSKRNLNFRVRQQRNWSLLNNSKYARRSVIGNIDVIKNFKRKELVDFYNKWFVPELQAIAVIGDINPKKIEKKIKYFFSQIPCSKNIVTQQFFPVENQSEPNYCVVTDLELKEKTIVISTRIDDGSRLQIQQKLKHDYICDAIVDLINQKLELAAKSDNIPYKKAFISRLRNIKGYDIFQFFISPKLNQAKEAITTAYGIYKYFLQTEFGNENLDLIISKFNKQNQANKDRIKSNNQLFNIILDAYVNQTSIFSEQDQYQLKAGIIKSITKENLFEKLKDIDASSNKNISVLMNENDEAISKEDVLSLMNSSEAIKIVNKTVDTKIKPIVVQENLHPSNIKKIKKIKMFDSESWIFENGAKVIYKRCTTNPGVINISATSKGGTSTLSDDEYKYGSMFQLFKPVFSIRGLSHDELVAASNSKGIKSAFSISSATEDYGLQLKNESIEDGFKLIYNTFSHPQFNETIYDKLIDYYKSKYAKQIKTPFQKLNDSIVNIINLSNRKIDYNIELFENFSFKKIKEIYHRKFGDASNFEFYIIGDIDKEQAKKLASLYIGNLRSRQSKETYRILESQFPKVNEKHIFKVPMNNAKAGNLTFFNHSIRYSYKQLYAFKIVISYLRKKLMDELRHKTASLYSVKLNYKYDNKAQNFMRLKIYFECNSNQVKLINKAMHSVIRRIKNEGIAESFFMETHQQFLRTHSSKKHDNAFYTVQIYNYLNGDVDSYNSDLKLIDLIYVNKVMRKFIDDSKIVDVMYM